MENDFKDLEISNNDSFFGSKNLNENTISIGRDLSNILGLDIGDEVSITVTLRSSNNSWFFTKAKIISYKFNI